MNRLMINKNRAILLLTIIILIVANLVNSNAIVMFALLIALVCGLYLSSKHYYYFIAFFILISTYFLYLSPFKVFGIQLDKLEIIILLYSYILWMAKKFRGYKAFTWNTKSLLFTLVIVFLGALLAKITCGQSLITGLFYQTRLLVILSVFPLVSLIKSENVNKKTIEDMIIRFSIIYSVLLLLQYLTITKFSFLNVEVNTSRFGNMRIYVYMFTAYAIFVCFSRLLRRFEKLAFIGLILNLLVLLFVVQSRMTIFGVIVSIAVAFMYCSNFKQINTYHKIGILVIGCIIFCFAFRDTLISFINLAVDEISNNSGNYAARFWEYDYYLNQVDNCLFGRGYISPKTSGASELVTAYGYYDLTDIGIVGLYVTNGIVGLAWYVLIAFSLFSYIKKLRIKHGDVFTPMCFLIFSICTCFNLLPFYYNAEYLVITYILLEVENKECIQLIKSE